MAAVTASGDKCHCGEPLHYTNPQNRERIDEFVRVLGPFVIVKGDDGREWRVQRHYIALHGLRYQDLPFLGFEEAKKGETEC